MKKLSSLQGPLWARCESRLNSLLGVLRSSLFKSDIFMHLLQNLSSLT